MVCVLLDIIYAFLMVLISPWLIYRLVVQRRYRYGWKERFGFVSRRFGDQPCIWIHAVSMGEINQIGTLVEQLESVLAGHEIIISSSTDTGMARAKKLYGASHRVFFYPLDFSCVVKRVFDRLHPQLCILMELEVWHNFTTVAARRGIPVMVANGRISSGKGFPRYRRIAKLVRPMFGRLALALVQDREYGERFEYLGVPGAKVEVVGSLKYDTAEVADKVEGADDLAECLGLSGDQLVWVAGSTGGGEEEIILESYRKLRKQQGVFENLRLVIVPRKPERFDEVARLIESGGERVLRYSLVKAGGSSAGDADGNAVILGDTMGDLRKFYSLASVVFVGRSLVAMGGSDMIEAAGLGKAVVVGPYTFNFVEAVKLLQGGDGIEVVENAEQLTTSVGRLLGDRDLAWAMGKRGREVIINNKGATQRSVEAIVKLLGYQMPLRLGGIATPGQ